MIITQTTRIWMITASLQALIAVIAGAFGAHALKGLVTEAQLNWWNTGCQYLMYHALACLLCAWCSQTLQTLKAAAFLFSLGNIFFAGSLMLMTITNKTWLGAITPIGGTLYLIGWLTMIWAFTRKDTH